MEKDRKGHLITPFEGAKDGGILEISNERSFLLWRHYWHVWSFLIYFFNYYIYIYVFDNRFWFLKIFRLKI